MIDGVRLKFCGLTSLVDATFADQLGADYLGFILYPKSPRFISLRDFAHLQPNLPAGRKRVAVMVEPSEAELDASIEAGFDRFQIHYGADLSLERVQGWSRQVGRERLWLAPKRPAEVPFDGRWLEYADTFLVDTFTKEGFGGSGQTGDWGAFARLQAEHSDHTWILAGGLGPDNLERALNESEARFVDINSGSEMAPGIKDHAKMKATVLAIHRHRTHESQPHE